MAETVKITKEKMVELEAELERRKLVDRKAILDRLVAARDLGDLKENAEYHISRDEQGYNEARIGQIEAMLKKVEIIEKVAGNRVGLASEVTIKRLDNNSERTFTLVSEHEADMSNGKLSETSPIGQALINRLLGEVVDVTLPSGIVQYEIIKIS